MLVKNILSRELSVYWNTKKYTKIHQNIHEQIISNAFSFIAEPLYTIMYFKVGECA